MAAVYADPIATLLGYGAVDAAGEVWQDYRAMGLTEEHVPELIRLATDADLNNSDQDRPEVWAPLHAWRTLAQLQAAEAAEPLVRLFEVLPYDEWIDRDLPQVFSMMGPVTIPTLAAFLGDDDVEESCRLTVPECLQQIAEDHPAHRDETVGVLARQMERYRTTGPTLNAFVILALANLEAREAIPLIREAFAGDHVDLTLQGDIEDVEIEMGLRTQRSTPRPRLDPFHGLFDVGDLDNHRDDFENTPVRRAFKVGRNDPCPCGSGKKYKKCCLS